MRGLKPCPFCGGAAEIWTDGYGEWGLVSHRAGCLFPQYPNHHIQKADFDAWNTRAERTCIAEENSDASYGDCMYVCSECGADFDNEEFPKYCPQCGAKVVDE